MRQSPTSTRSSNPYSTFINSPRTSCPRSIISSSVIPFAYNAPPISTSGWQDRETSPLDA